MMQEKLGATALVMILACAPAWASKTNPVLSLPVQQHSGAPADTAVANTAYGTETDRTTTGATSGSTTPDKDDRTAADRAAASMDRTADSISDLAQGMVPYAQLDLTGYVTAKSILGQDIHDLAGKKIAVIDDVIIDKDGAMKQLVIANGGILGIGAKLVIVDYSLVYQRANNGDVLMPLSENTIKAMMPFSYDADDAKNGMRTIPAGSLSVKEMLAGHMMNATGKEVASIRDVVFEEGKASRLIAAYKPTLGFGGHLFSIPFEGLTTTDQGSSVDVKLDTTMTSHFESFTRTVN